jgi:hypothetical protein
MHSYTKIIAPLNEIGSITETLYQVEKRSILHVRATKIKNLAMEARQWTMTLEGERNELEKQVLALLQELARLKGEPVPEANDQYTPNFATLYGGRTVGKKEE